MESIKCTVIGCPCSCYSPIKSQLRVCSSCQHGWVIHAMDKIGLRPSGHVTFSSGAHLHSGSIDPTQVNSLFDLASLILFGAEAIPTRLKILLDRLFKHLEREMVLQVLAAFGWSYEDYCRGYRMRDNSGHLLDKWTFATSDEELVILDQFLRFTETKTVAEEWLTSDHRISRTHLPPAPHPALEGQGKTSPLDVKQLLLNNSVPRSGEAETPRHLLGAGYLPSFLPRYPGIYNPFLTSAGSVGPLSQASVLPYLLCRSPLRSLPKPVDYRMESVECVKGSSTDRGIQGSPMKRNVKMYDVSEEPGGKAVRMVKLEVPEERNSLSQETAFHSTDEDEPINYSTKDDRVVPDLSTTNSPTVTIPLNPCVTGSPGESSDQELKNQQQRKSSSVPKKPYQPTPGYGGTLISPNGKKRVLCTACLKTFCDKGALKIHYSAVHLKELHKCTIEGCTMTFSSRRSRNRHSANPNPKLHFGQTGRRRLHNNNPMSPFKEGENEALCSSSPPSPPSGGGSPDVSEGEFQLCPRSGSDESEERSEGGRDERKTPQQSPESLGHDSASIFFLGLGLNRPNILKADSKEGKASDGQEVAIKKNEQDGEKSPGEQLKLFQVNEETGSLRNSSKRKSGIPTRCSVPPNEDSANEFHDLSSSEMKKPRLSDDHQCNDSDNVSSWKENEADGDSSNNAFAVNGKDYQTPLQNQSSVLHPEHERERHDQAPLPPESSVIAEDDSDGAVVDLSNSVRAKSSPCLQSNELNQDTDSHLHSEEQELDPGNRNVDDLLKRNFGGIHGELSADRKDCFQVQRSLHVCKIQGCNATFPSKRSRDRHSANTNLHRRLLSADSSSVPSTRWRGEGREEVKPVFNSAPLSERKKSLDAALNLTTNEGSRLEEEGQGQGLEVDMDKEGMAEDDSEDGDEGGLNEDTHLDSINDCSLAISTHKSHSLIGISGDHLHNHILVNSPAAAAPLAV